MQRANIRGNTERKRVDVAALAALYMSLGTRQRATRIRMPMFWRLFCSPLTSRCREII
jgi:hypothetical protein